MKCRDKHKTSKLCFCGAFPVCWERDSNQWPSNCWTACATTWHTRQLWGYVNWATTDTRMYFLKCNFEVFQWVPDKGLISNLDLQKRSCRFSNIGGLFLPNMERSCGTKRNCYARKNSDKHPEEPFPTAKWSYSPEPLSSVPSASQCCVIRWSSAKRPKM